MRILPLHCLVILVTASGLCAQSLDQKVQMLIDQNAQQQREIDSLRAQLAAANGQTGADVAAAESHDKILDLTLVDERVAHALEERGIQPGTVAAPGWLEGLVFKGDIRVRYEGSWYEDDEAFPEDRNRGRFRLRFGFEKTWGSDKDWSAGFRLVSGSGPEPFSTNQTFTDWFGKKQVWIDQAWIRWAPQAELLKGVEFVAGKMKNPFLTTWQHWDTDVMPEGVFEKYTADLGAFKAYANFGQFFVKENSSRPDDTSLLVYGGGFDWLLDEGSKTTLRFATNYYDYTHIHDNLPPAASGNPITTLPNGRKFLAAEDFDVLDFVFNLKGTLFKVDYLVYGDFGWNTGVDRDANDPEYDETFAIGLILGGNKKKGDISIEGTYARIEPNALIGYFTDGEFGNADGRGGHVRVTYSLTDFATLDASYWANDLGFEVDEDKDHQSLLQVDLNIKF